MLSTPIPAGTEVRVVSRFTVRPRRGESMPFRDLDAIWVKAGATGITPRDYDPGLTESVHKPQVPVDFDLGLFEVQLLCPPEALEVVQVPTIKSLIERVLQSVLDAGLDTVSGATKLATLKRDPRIADVGVSHPNQTHLKNVLENMLAQKISPTDAVTDIVEIFDGKVPFGARGD